jgi:hypothetical protein
VYQRHWSCNTCRTFTKFGDSEMPALASTMDERSSWMKSVLTTSSSVNLCRSRVTVKQQLHLASGTCTKASEGQMHTQHGVLPQVRLV